jgi:diguanylate cyclase (GGDEF)-like protein
MTQKDDRSGPDADELTRAADEGKLDLAARTQADADQTAADLEQTQSDSDQTGSEADQTDSDIDQLLADREQHASDRDQQADSGDEKTHAASRMERQAVSRERESVAASRALTTTQRLVTADQRDEVARTRDLTAVARDRTAAARDDAARSRDRAAEARERHAAETGDVDEAVTALRSLRVFAESVRRAAKLERGSAAADREAAAADRERAAADRRYAGLDELTGIFRRGTGEIALTNEVARSRRLDQSLVLAMIDVDGLKIVNDSQGHSSGDALLRGVAAAISSTMRAYDVTVRWGGDEFVCALSNVTLEVASERVADIERALATRWPEASISVGLAELEDDDTLDGLIARADTSLYGVKVARGA